MSDNQNADGDETPTLPSDTLAILQQFYAEQHAQSQLDENTDKMPEEDWQLSQFWYSEETAEHLAKEALAVAGESGSIACISCPTLYKALRQVKGDTNQICILEFDDRFKVFGDEFVFYDYNEPLAVPEHFKEAFDLVIADPPFLSEECLTKTSKTIKFMSKGKVLLCTGAIMEEHAKRLLGANLCKYAPKHTRNLANEFKCFSNYEPKVLDTFSTSSH